MVYYKRVHFFYFYASSVVIWCHVIHTIAKRAKGAYRKVDRFRHDNVIIILLDSIITEFSCLIPTSYLLLISDSNFAAAPLQRKALSFSWFNR